MRFFSILRSTFTAILPQFRRMASQGRVILDIDSSISEDTPVEEMVSETKQALL